MKNSTKQGIYNGASLVPMAWAGSLAYNSLNLNEQAMQEIVKQFENSGAENIQYTGTGITNFKFGLSDFNCNTDYTTCVLKNKMDFSAVPALYTAAGELGFKIALASEVIGGIAGLIAGRKASPEVNGVIKTARRMGAAYGLGQTLAARIGLASMPYTITNPAIDVYSLLDYSSLANVSATDISPLVESGVKQLNLLFSIGLGVGVAVEAACEINEYLKNRTPSETVENFKIDDLGVNSEPKPKKDKYLVTHTHSSTPVVPVPKKIENSNVNWKF